MPDEAPNPFSLTNLESEAGKVSIDDTSQYFSCRQLPQAQGTQD